MDILIIFGAKYLIAILIVVAVVYFFRQSWEVKKQLAVFALISLPIVYVVAKISSLFFYNARPFVSENVVPLVIHAADNGFPSDHTLLSAAVACAVYPYSKKVSAILFVLALLVGYSRILAGVHHAEDIIGSLVIAISVSFLMYKFVLPKVLKSDIFKKFVGN